MTHLALIELRGAGGEPVDLRRTLGSHGVAELPPMTRDEDGLGATVTLATPEGPRTVRLEAGPECAAETGRRRRSSWRSTSPTPVRRRAKPQRLR